jgi:DNA-damage-inducible protein D
MNIDIFKDNFENLENIWKTDENGVEFIYARDLAKVLGYGGKDYWRNFKNPLEKAIISCENNGEVVDDHFANVREMVEVGSRAKREIKDYKLTRYACYLIAQNGDPRKNEIAFAQNYFAVQTRNFEIVMQRKNDYDRVLERYELKEAERIFSEELYQRGVDSDGFARIRSKGDEALFGGNTTKQMKEKLDIPAKHHNRPLADFLNPALVTAKKLAMQLSNINIVSKDIKGETSISDEHIENNKGIRKLFQERTGVNPEQLPPAEDIKKVENRLNKDLKIITKSKKKPKDLGR